jgi:hypothetical protein
VERLRTHVNVNVMHPHLTSAVSVLSCPVLSCPVLFCSVLFCSVLFCSVLFCSVLFCSVLQTKWRVENSWGRDAADGGYYVMTDAWFKEWMYQIAVDVQDLPGDIAAVLDQSPSMLPAWDPMGSLAGYLPGPAESTVTSKL